MRNDDPDAVRRARLARQHMNASELMLWRRLRASALGFRFRRQYPIQRADTRQTLYLDFYCPAAKLCVEVDGDCHDFKQERDADRDAWLLEQGIITFRVRTFLLGDELPTVLGEIRDLCQQRSAP